MVKLVLNPETVSLALTGVFFAFIAWYSLALANVKKEQLVVLINQPRIIIEAFTYFLWAMVFAVIFLLIEIFATIFVDPIFPQWVMILYTPFMIVSGLLILLCFRKLGKNLRGVL